MQEVKFYFKSPDESYGMKIVGAKVCKVEPRSLADREKIQPGWVIATIDGENLQGAMSGLCRKVPTVTTDEVEKKLQARRLEAARAVNDRDYVRLVFWKDAVPYERSQHYSASYEAESVDSFKCTLVQKYGSIVKAWSEALDKNGDNELDYKEFSRACHEIGFTGSLKALFQELDGDGTGVISLTELDPTCMMDFVNGKCAVCGLDNPCENHGEQDQKQFILLHRKKIMSHGASNTAAMDWELGRQRRPSEVAVPIDD
jgi:hypothetical protein